MLREIIVGGFTVTPMAPCLAAAFILTYASAKAIPAKAIEQAALSRPWINATMFSAYLFTVVSLMKA